MTATAPNVYELATPLQGEDGKAYGNAFICGPLDQAILNHEITIAVGNRGTETWWENKRLSFGRLLQILSAFERGPKDGQCMLQGELVADGPRSSRGTKAMHLQIYDIDTGETLEEVVNRVPEGLCAVAWTTHSHMKTESIIVESPLMKRLKRDIPQPTRAEVVADLMKTKNARPEIFEGATLRPKEHLAGGVSFRLTHQPWPRVRLLLLLKKPFVFLERGGTHDAAIKEWKAYYAAVAARLGITHDPSCADPGRLFFTPRIPPDAKLATETHAGDAHDIWIVPGKPLDLDTIELPLPAKSEKAAKPEKAAKSAAAAPADEGFKTANLQRFLAIGGGSFRAADWLGEIAPGDIRHDYGDGEKRDCRCPREDSHTDPTQADRGFYAINGKGDAGDFQMFCPHAGCLAVTTRAGKHDRAVLLDLACEHYGIADAAELLPYCDDAAREQWAPDRTAPFEERQTGSQRLRLFAPGAERWRGKTATPAPFVVERLIPRDNVTLLVAAGGRGKSTMAQHLMTVMALGGDFLGFKVLETGTSAGVFCEDSDGTLHWRQSNICRGLGVDLDAVASKVDPKSFVGCAEMLWEKGKVTEFYASLDADLTAKGGLKMLVLDGTAHLYAGSEIDRGEVTRFINALTSLAAKHRIAIVLITHEAKSSADTDTHAASGSTAWINACRSVLKLNWPDRTNDVRELRHIKVNDAKLVQAPIRCELQDSLFVPLAGGAKRMEECMQLAAGLIDAAIKSRTNLSPNPTARNFVVKWAVKSQPVGGNFSEAEFKDAIVRLISDGIFVVEDYSSKGKPAKRICRHLADTSTSDTSPPPPERVSEANETGDF